MVEIPVGTTHIAVHEDCLYFYSTKKNTLNTYMGGLWVKSVYNTLDELKTQAEVLITLGNTS